jgi:hypothetical protein
MVGNHHQYVNLSHKYIFSPIFVLTTVSIHILQKGGSGLSVGTVQTALQKRPENYRQIFFLRPPGECTSFMQLNCR